MLFTRKVVALLLLGIFQVFVLHQALPHVHHTHDKTGGSKEQINDHLHVQGENSHHHHHSKDAHHHHQSDEANNQQNQAKTHHDGLLGFILASHSHSDGTSHKPVLKTVRPHNLKVKDLGGFLLTAANISVKIVNTDGYHTSCEAAKFQHNRYNPFFNHRGPPTII